MLTRRSGASAPRTLAFALDRCVYSGETAEADRSAYCHGTSTIAPAAAAPETAGDLRGALLVGPFVKAEALPTAQLRYLPEKKGK